MLLFPSVGRAGRLREFLLSMFLFRVRFPYQRHEAKTGHPFGFGNAADPMIPEYDAPEITAGRNIS